MVGMLGAVTLIGVLVALPAPGGITPGVAANRQPAASGAAAVSTVAQVWPHAHTYGFPALLPDGSTVDPITITDPDLVVATITDPANTRLSLATVSPAATVRVLKTFAVDDAASVAAFAATATEFFWMDTVVLAPGNNRISLRRALRAGGPGSLLTADVGTAVFANSRYDLQVAGDRLYWVAAPEGSGHRTELRSVPLSGGRVSTRRLPGDYTLTAWPWLTSRPGGAGSHIGLLNLLTGAYHTVAVPPNQPATCTPAWCRMQTANTQDTSLIDLIRPDGTDRRRIGTAHTSAISDDVALRDRFEVLATPTPSSTPDIFLQQVHLYDIPHRRTVLLAPAASSVGARGDYVWWSTGDNESITWHALDLRSLT
jgi:hypothetical protein